jgi:hypothetical protein
MIILPAFAVVKKGEILILTFNGSDNKQIVITGTKDYGNKINGKDPRPNRYRQKTNTSTVAQLFY